MNQYIELVPRPVLEAPYQLSMISLYDADFNEIWYHEQANNEFQEHDKAQVRIRQLCELEFQGEVLWSEPIEINLDLTEELDPAEYLAGNKNVTAAFKTSSNGDGEDQDAGTEAVVKEPVEETKTAEQLEMEQQLLSTVGQNKEDYIRKMKI